MRQVNLLPEEMKRAGKINFIRNGVIATFLPLFVVLILIHFALGFHVSRLKQIADLPPTPIDTPAIKELRMSISHYKNDMVAYAAQNGPVVSQVVNSVNGSQLLGLISAAGKDMVWLNHFSLNTGTNQCVLEGQSMSTRLVSEFILKLKDVPHFQNVDLVTMEKKNDEKAAEVSFKINGVLK